MPTDDTQRVQFDINPELRDRLETLMHRGELATKKALFNEAITLLEWAFDSAEAGLDVARIDRASKHFEVLRTPALDAVRRHAKKTAN